MLPLQLSQPPPPAILLSVKYALLHQPPHHQTILLSPHLDLSNFQTRPSLHPLLPQEQLSPHPKLETRLNMPLALVMEFTVLRALLIVP